MSSGLNHTRSYFNEYLEDNQLNKRQAAMLIGAWSMIVILTGGLYLLPTIPAIIGPKLHDAHHRRRHAGQSSTTPMYLQKQSQYAP